MNPKFTPEQSAALSQHPGEPLRIEDPTGNRVYVVLDEDLAARAMRALEEQQTWHDLQESIAQINDGQTVAHDDAVQAMRSQLGFANPS
jgi:hypothetical protein